MVHMLFFPGFKSGYLYLLILLYLNKKCTLQGENAMLGGYKGGSRILKGGGHCA